MDFAPKGCIPLTGAVDQLAETRRGAGQTNDDGLNAARAELRVALYSGAISTAVVCPRSGKTFHIRSHYWAREEALTWLEQGECLLTEYLVDPPLGLLYGEERVKIFVSQNDFQRLVAKQEDKQEAVPPPDSSPSTKPVSEADAVRKFDEWRESRGDNIPSEKEDINYMKQFGVSRDRVREMRQRPGVKLRSTGERRLP
jgi:hypothetical protein